MRRMQHRPLATSVLLAVTAIACAATTSLEVIGAWHSVALLNGRFGLVPAFAFLDPWLDREQVPNRPLAAAWLALQALGALLSPTVAGGVADVAYWAHLGGFLAGTTAALFCVLFTRLLAAASAGTIE